MMSRGDIRIRMVSGSTRLRCGDGEAAESLWAGPTGFGDVIRRIPGSFPIAT